MTRTSIEWATDSWNPIAAYDKETGKRGWFCTKVSPGCTNCYAEQWNRFRGNGHLYRAGNLDKVRFELAPTLTDPLHWRKPRRVFVNSMTDLFLESHTNEMIAAVLAVIAIAHYFGLPHEFLVLTKRPARMRELFASTDFWQMVAVFADDLIAEQGSVQQRSHARKAMCEDKYDGYVIVREPRVDVPLPNLWGGVSVENQEEGDLRIPLLLQTRLPVRFLSCEPLLGPVDIMASIKRFHAEQPFNAVWENQGGIDWAIAGLESGPKARQGNVAWISAIVAQCAEKGVPVFVKQMGSRPTTPDLTHWSGQLARATLLPDSSGYALRLRDRKGGDPKEWPTELRVRQYPKEVASV